MCLSFVALADDKIEVTNGKAPKGKAITLELEETLRLGEEDNDEFLFSDLLTSVYANDKGHMYVADYQNKRVMRLDENGKFLGNVGAAGDGPGEYRNLAGFQVLADGRLILHDNLGQVQHFNFFKADGTFIERKSHNGKMLQAITWSPDGSVAHASYLTLEMAEGKIRNSFGLVDENLNPVGDAFVSTAVSMPNQARFGDPNYWADYLAENISASAKGLMGAGGFDAKNQYYYATLKDYKIHKASKPGKADTLVFGREYKPIPQTEEEIKAVVEPIGDAIRGSMPGPLKEVISQNVVERAMAKAEFPNVKHPLSGMLVMDDKYVLAIHNLDALKNLGYVDIFDTNSGKFVGQFTYKLRGLGSLMRMTFKNGNAYTVENNEDDEAELVRYRVNVVAAK